MNKFLRFTLATFLLFVCNEFRAQTTAPIEKIDTFTCNLLFPINAHIMDNDWRNNAEIIHQIDSIVRYYHDNHDIYSIEILGVASFDGPSNKNLELSKKRASSVKKYLSDTFSFLKQTPISANGLGENWKDLRKNVLQDNKIPAQKQLLSIINNNRLSKDAKEVKIKQLNNGATFRYLKRNILPLQRWADIRILAYHKEDIPPVPEQVEIVVEEPEVIEQVEEIIEPIIQKEIPEPPVSQVYSRPWALKTNLLFLAAGVANAGVEFSTAKHFSIDIPVTYSPYTIKRDWRLRTLSIQPEFRWWPASAMNGHFIGLHGHAAYYNISTDMLDRYQDTDGETPLWGFGLSYGYTLHLKGRWNMEFTVGGGYARLDYDVFVNVKNGMLYDNQKKDYWGITRTAVNISYHFNK